MMCVLLQDWLHCLPSMILSFRLWSRKDCRNSSLMGWENWYIVGWNVNGIYIEKYMYNHVAIKIYFHASFVLFEYLFLFASKCTLFFCHSFQWYDNSLYPINSVTTSKHKCLNYWKKKIVYILNLLIPIKMSNNL